MKFISALFLALLIVACSSSSPQQENVATAKPVLPQVQTEVSCAEESDLRGEGVGPNYQQALVIAQKGIAAQIQSSVSAVSRSVVSQVEDSDGNEIIKSSYDVEASVLTRLENAQDVKVVQNQPYKGQVKVVACMSRSDAVKPFKIKSRILQDSLHISTKAFEGALHPLLKGKFYRNGRQTYIEYVANRNILQSFGAVDSAASAAVNADYSLMHKSYSDFVANYVISFENPSNELEQLVFAEISKNYKVVGGSCKGGLHLKAGSQNLNCKEGSLGIKCSVTLTLSGSSCEGELYFDLQASVAGAGKYDESEAMEKLNKNVQKAEWLSQWSDVLNQWRLK